MRLEDKTLRVGIVGGSLTQLGIYKVSNLIIETITKILDRNKIFTKANDDGSFTDYKYSDLDKKSRKEFLGYCSFPKIEIVVDNPVDCCSVSSLSLVVLDLLFQQRYYSGLQYTKVGFIPQCLVSNELCQIDKQIIVGENYDDTTQAFIEYLDVLIQIGDDKESMTKVGNLVRQYKPSLIHIKKKFKVI